MGRHIGIIRGRPFLPQSGRKRARRVCARAVQLSEAEDKHQDLAQRLGERVLSKDVRTREDESARRMFVLHTCSPALPA
jgi:hypothetical protein